MLITKVIHTETGHRLANYKGRCAHFHGHSYRWEVTVKGDNLDNGMVMDFKVLKSILNDTIDTLDHAFILSNLDPLVLEMGEHAVREMMTATDGSMARLNVVPFNPTVENLAQWQFDRIVYRLPSGITLHKIKCWETSTSFCEITAKK